VHVRVTGPRPKPGTLLACNHISWFDIVLIGAVMPLSFVAKSEVKSWPLFGHLARLQRTVFVERRRTKSALSKRTELRRRLEQGDRLVLFAEGTSSDGMRVLPFKSAFFAAVAEADARVHVQPMTLAYRTVRGMAMGRRQRMAYAWIGDVTLVAHLLYIFSTPPLRVELAFHAPLDAALLDDRKQMAAASEAAVRAGYDAIFTGGLEATPKNS